MWGSFLVIVEKFFPCATIASHIFWSPLLTPPKGYNAGQEEGVIEVPDREVHDDCAAPVEDRVLDVASFEKFSMDKIKVNGKAGPCETVVLTREKTKIIVAAQMPSRRGT